MRKSFGIITIAIIILITGNSCSRNSNVDVTRKEIVSKDALHEQIANSSDFNIIEENDLLALYIKGSTAEIMIEDKKSKQKWFSNPQDIAKDTIASTSEMELLSSQVTLKYYDKTDNLSTMNSSTDSVLLGQYSFAKIDNGIRITYTIGQAQNIILVPKIIEKGRMAKFVSSMSTDQKKYVGDRYIFKTIKGVEGTEKEKLVALYPSITDSDIYVMASDYPLFIQETLQAAFVSIGYNEAELKIDNESNNVPELPTPVGFVIPVDYTILNDSFSAKISANTIATLNNEVKLTNISLLPYFGASSINDSGYIFVPDGSGAIINNNNEKTQFSSYSIKVYNRDYGLEQLNKPISDERCFLPVFGAKKNENAYLAIIENGDAYAYINAATSKKQNMYNYVFAEFTYKEFDKVNTAVDTSSKMNVYQKNSYMGDYKVSYKFLSGENANYSGMANVYKKYLVDKGVIKQIQVDKSAMNLTIIGSVDYNKSVLGFPVNADKSLTTYEQAIDILQQLKERNVNDISLQYKYWANKGAKNSIYSKVNLLSVLGNNNDFSKLVSYTNENNITFSPDVDFFNISSQGLFKGFIAFYDAARLLSGDYSFNYEYNISTSWRNRQTKKYILSPNSYDKVSSDFIKSYKKLGANSVSVSSIGTMLYSDFNNSKNILRNDAIIASQKILSNLKSNGYDIVTSGSNVYTLQYLSAITDIPYESSNHYIIDQSVPFYQMVIHGFIPYSSMAINLASDYQYDELKALETGSNLHFEWIYEENSELKNTEYDIYGVYYKPWLDQAVSSYTKVSSVLNKVKNSQIISHRMIQSGVYATTYDNNITIYTNYNKTQQKCDGITVAAMNFAVKGVE